MPGFHCSSAWPYGQAIGHCLWVNKNPNRSFYHCSILLQLRKWHAIQPTRLICLLLPQSGGRCCPFILQVLSTNHQLWAVYRLLPKWQQNPAATHTVPESVPGEKRLSALEYLPSLCTPQKARFYINHFRFITDSSGHCLLYCSLSAITEDIMSVSGFEIILWLLVIVAVSINVQ